MSPGGPVCFYGDDFTGATAHLAGFHEAGLNALMFLRTPTLAQAQRHLADEDVLGVAGISRSLAPAAMDQEIGPAFALFRALGARQAHYKICSTFDSSPRLGSIGRAIEIGRACFGAAPVPVVPACPSFGRYVVFGNLYAQAGDAVHRLDRHPAMSRHPATPMNEADLRRHLAGQTTLASALVDWRAVRAGGPALAEAWREAAAGDPGAVVFDTLEDADLDRIAAMLWEASAARPLFCVAAQGLAEGLGRHMAQVTLARRRAQAGIADAGPMLVLSGSAAPQNAVQIERALAAGWEGIRVDMARALSETDRPGLAREVGEAMLAALRGGRSVVAYTARGPDDPAIGQVRGLGLSEDVSVAAVTGLLFAQWARLAVQGAGLGRLVLAGGDTSSLAMRGLDAYALRIAAIARQGGRLCRLVSDQDWLDGVEVMLKGGQVGGPDAFVDAARAEAWRV
ncbi:four-carbon acid sugar kinase family protein [Bordetella bronchiseptica]|uniref:Four-carbon acid sugar kinase family protein n=5 Tax=Bordetella bronchiseptica TaxID=518 RepID=A0A0C6P4D9_BORBO|nr:four-carbon acid sugar kinase family protein [Bordetella bronchiseptica]SHR13616.1 Uncharacterized protein conserved in bacteria [Mycobacteroides abscessus subsp. abscessus]AWP73869.1 hypothetical protein B7P10_05060 [Bordetella bronchiseptica]AWP83513.1 hypothetical protein B7P00_05120 [Bordetella bronchiseptica]AWQ09080.1 hypothetical protein B9G72_05115 [Bordetella bronchiseptica]AXT90542.1 hypothetical protein CJ015_19255 [Bordetella bronchiseptica]